MKTRNTTVSIRGNDFLINGVLTYKDKSWLGISIEGLLFNSRMVQGIFDDLNPETRHLFAYPDTGKWDAARNTREFVEAMPIWKAHGLLAFTLNFQGGSPTGYGNKGWINSGFLSDGSLNVDYLNRLEKILDEADKLGMVVILGYFYFGQDQVLKDESAVRLGVENLTKWLIGKNYRNVLIEVNNECDIHYTHDILKAQNVHRLIMAIKGWSTSEFPLYVGTSFSGGTVPTDEVIATSDFILLHGNGVHEPARIGQICSSVRANHAYAGQPIVFNEDDHFEFEKETNNFVEALKANASWGFFDYRLKGEDMACGFQSVPVNWGIDSKRKLGFFKKLKEITGA